jgi:hypothetical protein
MIAKNSLQYHDVLTYVHKFLSTFSVLRVMLWEIGISNS